MLLPAGFATNFGYGFEKIVSVNIAQEDVVLLIATAHQVIHGAGILDSNLVRHGANGLVEPNLLVNLESQMGARRIRSQGRRRFTGTGPAEERD